MINRPRAWWGCVTGLVMLASIAGCESPGQTRFDKSEPVNVDEATGQLVFDSPEQAAQALSQATHGRDRAELQRIFGPDMAKLGSGNERQDHADFQRFAAAFDRKWELKRQSDGLLYVMVGESAWE